MGFHALCLVVATLLLYHFQLLPYLGLPAALSFLLFFARYAYQQGNFAFALQPANLVTQGRLCLLFLLLWYYPALSALPLGLLALVVLILDGLDGYLARRFQTSSVFGEYLDMETDAFYVLGMSMLLYELNYFGGWILGIGLLRYAYFLVLRKVKAPQQKESRLFLARLIAVILMATMAACFILPPWIHQPAMIIASGLVLYSFGNSFWLSWKPRFQVAEPQSSPNA